MAAPSTSTGHVIGGEHVEGAGERIDVEIGRAHV